MTTILAAAQARAAQATAARESAEDAMGIMMDDLGISTGGLDVPDAIHCRQVEARIELDPFGEFARAYSAYRRALTAEAKARRALLHARLAPAQPARPAEKPRPRPRSRPRTFAEALALEAAW